MSPTQNSSKKRPGQSLVEYAAVLCLVALVVVGAVLALGGWTADRVEDTTDGFEALQSQPDPGPALHVADIHLKLRGRRRLVSATVKIVDGDENRAGRATVNVSWFVNGTSVGDESRRTKRGGKVRFSYRGLELGSGDVVRLTVIDVSKSEHWYDSDSNVESADEIEIP